MSGPKYPVTVFAEWPVGQILYMEDADGKIWAQSPRGFDRMSGDRFSISQKIGGRASGLRGDLIKPYKKNPAKRRKRSKMKKTARRKRHPQDDLIAARARELTWHAPRKKNAAKRKSVKRKAKSRAIRYKITAQNTGKRMHYDGRNFSERTPKSFALAEDAKTTALMLIRRFPVLRRYRVRVESFP